MTGIGLLVEVAIGPDLRAMGLSFTGVFLGRYISLVSYIISLI